MKINLLDPRYTVEQAADAIGFIPDFLQPNDKRPAWEQFHERYAHGGGWSPISGFKMGPTAELRYPGDPDLSPIVVITNRLETIYIYPHALVAIVQQDGSFEVARMD